MPIQYAVDILMVEDRDEDIELTLMALKKHNLANNMKVVRDGEKALEFIFATGEYSYRAINKLPKLILLDLKLPKVSGFEVLRQIRADERTKSTPVVILTSSSENIDISEGYRLGANSYIVKPVNFDNFVKAVSEVGLYWLLLNSLPK